MTIKGLTELAMQTVIMDAMEKGHTNKNELIQYMKSDTFKSSVNTYVNMFKEEFKEVV